MRENEREREKEKLSIIILSRSFKLITWNNNVKYV